MHQVIFLNCFNCLFEGAILLCKKTLVLSKAPQCQTLPFALVSRGGESPGGESFPCYIKAVLRATWPLTTPTFWAQLPGVFALGSPMSTAPLLSRGQAVTRPRAPPAEHCPLPTVCCHSAIKEDVSLIKDAILAMRTASLLQARQLLPLLPELHISRPVPAISSTTLSARAVFPSSCKDPLAFCTPWGWSWGWFLHLCHPCACTSPLPAALLYSLLQ